MNIYSYFQNVEKSCKSVPTKNAPLYNWCIFKVKQANLSKYEVFKIINWVSESLQDDESSKEGFEEQVKIKIEDKKKSFWLREFSDFPLYLFLYITCLSVLYDIIVEVLFEQGQINWNMNISLGLLIQILGVYVSFKLLLLFLGNNPKRSSLMFWFGLMALFGIYMFSNYALRVFDTPLFTIPVILWIGLTFVLFILSINFIKKEKLI